MRPHRDPVRLVDGTPRSHRPGVDMAGLMPPEWTRDALCAQTDPEIFFPDVGGSARKAKAICRHCPVQVECLEDALAHGDRHGIFGGLSGRERLKLGKGAT